jgi:hypothetical protein
MAATPSAATVLDSCAAVEDAARRTKRDIMPTNRVRRIMRTPPGLFSDTVTIPEAEIPVKDFSRGIRVIFTSRSRLNTYKQTVIFQRIACDW